MTDRKTKKEKDFLLRLIASRGECQKAQPYPCKVKWEKGSIPGEPRWEGCPFAHCLDNPTAYQTAIELLISKYKCNVEVFTTLL